MSNILGYIARPADGPSEPNTFTPTISEKAYIYYSLDDALACAKGRARADGKPWAVYKVIQTHYISVPAPVVEEV